MENQDQQSPQQSPEGRAPMALNASAGSTYGQPLSECEDVQFLRGQVEHLYQLLDDIDTASDMFKPCDSNKGSFEAFYEYAMRRQAAKSDKLESDGYKLHLSNTESNHEMKGVKNERL
jgi:hypothetical protein